MTPERWQQIEALYHAALARPAHERAAYLADACPSDTALRREVEHLLSQPASDEGFLAGSVAHVSAGLTDAPPVMVGRTLGGYQVQALIGVGGMGEVYRARDAKLGRAVAIKVLPHAFTSDPARLARFEREARTLAALNHPNICAIHGFEEADNVRFLILELVDGETLADRLAAARVRPNAAGLPLRDALGIARQIARALDFAHDRGIVHRDLKPANIKIGPDGSAKVLDFGLAKAAAGDAAGADLEALPGITADGTLDGAIVGTPAYMSPEQARGKSVDKRTDIWSFGCVLYEMLTGRAVFAGDTLADTIARVIEREPDWTLLPADTPEPIRNLLLGCLAKDPRERLRDIGDVRITIDSMLSGSSSGTTGAPSRRSTWPSPAWLPWAVVAVLAVVLVWSLQPKPAQVVRVNNDLQAGQDFDRSGGAHVVTISGDGTQVAYVARPHLLYLWRLDRAAAPLLGIQVNKGVREPVFSPDGTDLAFYSFGDRKLKRMPVAGGPEVTICPADTPMGISWGADGIVFGQGRKGIMRVSPNGGPVETIVTVEGGQQAHGPQMLPDGDTVLFTLATGGSLDRWDQAEIFVQSITTRVKKSLKLTGSDARYLKSGHLVYASRGVVYAVRFDLQRLEIEGSSVAVELGVSRAAWSFTGGANFSVSDNGVLVFVPGPASTSQARMELALIDPVSKTSTRLNLPPDAYDSFRMSPDETQISFGNERDKDGRIYTYPISGASSPQPLTTPGSNNRYATWTRDSKRIAFQSIRDKDNGIWWQATDRSDTATRLTQAVNGDSHIPESWFDDTLLFSITTKDGLASLWTLSVKNGKPTPPRPFGTSTSTHFMSAVFSPDGTLVAYTKTERGETTVCVEPFPANSPYFCIEGEEADSPKHPHWSPNGRQLYYDPRVGDFEVRDVITRPQLQLVNPKPVEYHPFRLAPIGFRTPYDVTPSGKFLGQVTQGKGEFEPQYENRIVTVLNWVDHLKQKVK